VARPTSRFVCQRCGDAFLRWEGQCRGCGEWNTLVETVVREPSRARAGAAMGDGSPPEPLSGPTDSSAPRRPTGLTELDRVLGGGLVGGSVVVIGGEPGIGKSTLVVQAAVAIAASGASSGILYVSGEESVGQVRLRAARLGLDGRSAAAVSVVSESDVGRIVDLVREWRPSALIVDSIQTVRVDELEGPAGSVGQVRESAARLSELARAGALPVVLVGHVTKDGTLAGPRTLEHLVDVVLTLEGDRYGGLRLLRALKNRFGSTEEVGVLEMGEAGLIAVADPARAFLVEHTEPAPGSVVAATIEGSRPILVEVQALVAPSGYGMPARRSSGLAPDRLALILAVLGRRAGIGLGGHDVYVNLAGGLALDDPGLDLPLAVALASSYKDRPVAVGTVVVGELGLLGETRVVRRLEGRLREAARLGFRRAIVPAPRTGTALQTVAGIEVAPVATLRDALGLTLGDR
jgi:DNA repair protein RadA/Sms